MSVCLNLSEGSARLKKADRKRMFNISYSSQKEVQTLILMAALRDLTTPADWLAAHLYRLQQRAL